MEKPPRIPNRPNFSGFVPDATKATKSLHWQHHKNIPEIFLSTRGSCNYRVLIYFKCLFMHFNWYTDWFIIDSIVPVHNDVDVAGVNTVWWAEIQIISLHKTYFHRHMCIEIIVNPCFQLVESKSCLFSEDQRKQISKTITWNFKAHGTRVIEVNRNLARYSAEYLNTWQYSD